MAISVGPRKQNVIAKSGGAAGTALGALLGGLLAIPTGGLSVLAGASLGSTLGGVAGNLAQNIATEKENQGIGSKIQASQVTPTQQSTPVARHLAQIQDPQTQQLAEAAQEIKLLPPDQQLQYARPINLALQYKKQGLV